MSDSFDGMKRRRLLANASLRSGAGGPRQPARRTLVRLVAAGLVTPWSVVMSASAPSMRRREIPASGEALPVIGLGTSDEFESAADKAGLAEVLRRFHELGGRLVDTAPIYGNAETVIGELIGKLGLRDALFLATKVRARGRDAGLEQMARSSRLLGRRTLDLMQVHSLVDVDTQIDNLRRWKDEGRVRYIGVTHSRVHAFDELERIMKTTQIDFVQLNYSFTEPDAERRLLPLAADRGIAVLVNRPFENGALFRKLGGRPLPDWAAEFDCGSWAQFSLKYILGDPAVTCVIPATSNPRHLVDNMGAGSGRLPDAAARQRMRRLGASL